jgi:hypothetical protein
MRLLSLLGPLLLLTLAACPAERKPAPGGNVAGVVVGAHFDGASLTIGKGELQGKAVVITYFATW